MRIQDWKFFDKQGHQLNCFPDSYINLEFTSPVNGRNAGGFLITNPSTFAIGAHITDSGYLYNEATTLAYKYVFDPTNSSIPLTINTEVSIGYIDVSIFNPTLTNTKGIDSVSIIDLSTHFIYPSFTYAAALFFKPVSVGLIETEQLLILEVSTGQYIRPYDDVNSSLIFQMIGDEDEIQLYTVDEDTVEVVWTDQIIVNDLNLYLQNTPLTINIGFRSEEEGVFERKLRIYHVVGSDIYTLAEFIINAQAIGEDERFRTLLGNFGLPDPKDFPKLFKQADINEDLPDWELLNAKSKHMILEHDKIMPYVGTYKALINALKWLGYDDIYIREWFKNVKENKSLSLLVPYNAKDRAQTILTFSPEERKTLKKLNQLSLIYNITYETGEVDDWGTPITANSYTYNLQEVHVKLLALKQWLEKNIIGVNCKITDITGEGVYFERFQNLIYSTGTKGFNYEITQTLTPHTIYNNSELITGEASIYLTFSELTKTKIKDLPYRFKDLIFNVWNPLGNPSIYYDPNDASILSWDPSLLSVLKIGPTFAFPFIHLNEIQWKASTQKDHGVLDNTLVSNELFVHENDLKFYNPFDSSSVFFDVSTNLKIIIERAYLRDPSIDEWTHSIAYDIFPNPCDNGQYILRHLNPDVCTYFNSYVSLVPFNHSRLEYAYDDNYKVPLLSLRNYKGTDIHGNDVSFGLKYYFLDIIDGKITMDSGMNNQQHKITHLNFNYDTNLEEQQITLNVVYESQREPLFQIDPSIYFWADPSGRAGTTDPSVLTIDNSIHSLKVNHIGDYTIELYVWDGFNNAFQNYTKETHPVWIKTPTIYSLNDSSILENPLYCVSTYMSITDVSILISNNRYPIYDKNIPLQGLTLEYDENEQPFIKVPSITYFQDLPENNSINRFFNLTERVTNINGNTITIDQDYQKFYAGDNIRLIKFNKGKYSLIAEASSRILTAAAPNFGLDNLPASISIDSQSDVYVLNDTYRGIKGRINSPFGFGSIEVSGYIFEPNQMVSVIATDLSTNYSWGGAYRITKISGNTHDLDNLLPNQFLENPNKYKLEVKHAFSTYAHFSIDTSFAFETGNYFKIYLKNDYFQQYYLDNTFVLINVLFDQEKVNEQWYDVSDNLINRPFYYYNKPINIDVSTLVIFKAQYDSSTYLLNQKNIWTVKNSLTKDILFKVYNKSVPYIFDVSGYYDVQVESYDKYGNLSLKNYEGLIHVENYEGFDHVVNEIKSPEPFVFELTITSPNTTITIPHLESLSSTTYEYDYIIDYGDSNDLKTVKSYNDSNATHTYVNPGIYKVTITGKCETFDIYNGALKTFVTKILSWGNVGLKIMTLYGCTNLTYIPNDVHGGLSEITSFYYAFRNCNKLTSIPSDIFKYTKSTTNFTGVFRECSNITSIPEGLFDNCIKATTYWGAFISCVSIHSIPETLFAHSPNVTDFSWTFYDTQINSIPVNLFKYNPEVTSFNATFNGGPNSRRNLTQIPAGLFDNNPKVTNFASTFEHRQLITEIPAGLFDHNPLVTTFSSVFYSNYEIQSIPAGLFDHNPLVEKFGDSGVGGAFSRLFRITSIPAGLFDNCPLVWSFADVFRDCSALTSIPQDLFKYNVNVSTFEKAFGSDTTTQVGCISLQSIDPSIFHYNPLAKNFTSTFSRALKATGNAPPLWITHPTAVGTRCFYLDASLSNYAAIPAGWK